MGLGPFSFRAEGLGSSVGGLGFSLRSSSVLGMYREYSRDPGDCNFHCAVGRSSSWQQRLPAA